MFSVGVASAMTAMLVPGPTQNAVANGDTRTLYLYHTHTRESIQATFMVDGRYDSSVLEKLNWFLRDWRVDEPIKMDPRLFDTVWETYRESGSREPIQIVSAYRSPRTNAMLRRRSKAVAEHSQHMLGKAMDMHYVDVPMSRIREIGMKLQRGGVGYYPTAGSPFVHLDVGSVRAWPRMSYDQLARLFPDGKTVHLPANGQPLARYEEARAEIEGRSGQSIPSVAQVKSKGFFASLFGLDDEENAPAAAPTSGPRSRVASLVASRRTRGQAQPAEPAQEAPVRSAAVDRAERDLPRGQTFMQPVEPVLTAPDRSQVASLDPRRGALDAQAARLADVPAPPRRPAELSAPVLAMASTPMPPSRPSELAARQLAEARTLRPAELPAVITTGASGPVGANIATLPTPTGLLAYAPANSNPALPEPPKPPVRAIALRPTLAAPPSQPAGIRAAAQGRRPELVAARLDRSNFRVLTSPAHIAQATPTGFGPAVAPVRAAARADLVGAVFAGPVDVANRFTRSAAGLSDKAFSGPAVQALPRLEQASAEGSQSARRFN
jgi:uncharacterized protein YcbK (DUF882 family)